MIDIHKYELRLTADPSRVVMRPFQIAQEPRDLNPIQYARALRIVRAVLELTPEEAAQRLEEVNTDFAKRHWQTTRIHLNRYNQIAKDLQLDSELPQEQRELIGAYFCHEYSYAAASIMNPSIVPHIDQSGLGEHDQRFIISLRTVGEGHISSISFREGIINVNDEVRLRDQPKMSWAAEAETPIVDQSVIAHRPDDVPISSVVIFPFTMAQRNGIEDLRLVRFTDDDGEVTYYGTYTAYSGAAIRSELLSTKDFVIFKLDPLQGDASYGKGMALFPRRINGEYAMLSRHDGENIYYMESDDLYNWNNGDKVLAPQYPWELVLLGNCGSPIELDEGWLLVTHGVGAMRKYSLGAVLLDKANPRQVIARLPEPLLAPSDENRDGYVPNVLYTCGAMLHGNRLFMPYAIADSSVAFALIDTQSLLQAMV